MPDPTVLSVDDAVTLRLFEPADAPLVLAASRDPDSAVMSPIRLIEQHGADGALMFCEERADWSDGTHASWAVDLGGELAGGISLFHLDFEQSNGEIGYWIRPELRRRGLASSALGTVARYGFEVLSLHRLELYHAVENLGSCAVARKAGFVQEGVHRDSFLYGDGRFHDEHSHARLAGDPG